MYNGVLTCCSMAEDAAPVAVVELTMDNFVEVSTLRALCVAKLDADGDVETGGDRQQETRAGHVLRAMVRALQGVLSSVRQNRRQAPGAESSTVFSFALLFSVFALNRLPSQDSEEVVVAKLDSEAHAGASH